MTFPNRLIDVILACLLAGMAYYEFKSVTVAIILFFVMVVVFNLDGYITDQRIKESKA